ncbi:hypothetical protein D3C75_735800 [compost metagenome]
MTSAGLQPRTLKCPADICCKKAQSALMQHNAAANQNVVEAVGQVAEECGVSRAEIALAWLYRNPVVAASIVAATVGNNIVVPVASK